MKPVRDLDASYVATGTLDVRNIKVALGLNLVGLVLLLVFGWLFLQAAALIRPDISEPRLLDLTSALDPLAIIIGLVVMLIVHELIHGLFFWLFTGARPKFGFHLVYAYAAAPGWYLPRNQFLVIGLAPFLVITTAGLVLLALTPFSTVPLLLFILVMNGAGSVGDLVVTGWLLAQPATARAHDSGATITLYNITSPEIEAMQRHWLALTRSLGVEGEDARMVFGDLVAHYTASNRHYHNLEHISLVLDTIDSLKDLARDMVAVELAVWFHDVIYDPRANDNEVKSAEYARRALLRLRLPAGLVNRVADLILATITHQATDDDVDAQILLDADLAPLGADAATFKRQTQAVRQEFAWVPEEEYHAKRVKLLGNFLKRERIFQTDRLYEMLEDQARQNLTTNIKEIS